jgi:hypothetical protein
MRDSFDRQICSRLSFAPLIQTLVLGFSLAAGSVASAATITIVNLDDAGVGLNDTTAAALVGGNTGTTKGEQALIAFQEAAAIWGGILESPVEIRVGSRFGGLSCGPTSGTLGSAAPNTAHINFTNSPKANTWYVEAQANSLAGSDLSPGTDDINMQFNGNLGSTGCLQTLSWYYGLDNKAPGETISLVSVALHEIGHGLGFTSLTGLSSGAMLNGFPDTYVDNLENHSTGLLYPQMTTDAERVAASTNTGNLHWDGAAVNAASGSLSSGVSGGHVEMYAPDPQQSGSSVSHFSTALTPSELMEPSYTSALLDPGLAVELFIDLGWQVVQCGDGVVDSTEQCDDGNTDNGDCCSSTCTFETNGSSCDDGLFCTTGETCTAGVCGGGGATDCSGSADQCNDGVCNETTDACEAQAANEGLSCDDGLFCNSGETCSAGVCGGGGATDCSDQCNDGVCDETTDACEAQPANEGQSCDDGLFCNTGETCTAGVCGGGGATDCSGSADQCNDGVCNETTDACEAQAANEGNGCNDGDLCTTGDVCASGSCDGAPVDCSGLDGDCTSGVCNAGTGGCESSPINEGGGCDDGLFCNTGETCTAGVCGGGGPTDCSGSADPCNDGVCNETTDACEAQAANEGLACDDGLFCNEGETCTAGACVGGGPIDCSGAADQCNDGVCNETTDACDGQPTNEGLSCDDGDVCTEIDTCQAGVCGGPDICGPYIETSGQSKCLTSLNKAGGKVTATQGKEYVSCVRSTGKGKETDPATCVLADAKGKVAGTEEKTLSTDAGKCTVEVPDFGYTSGGTINDAARAAALDLGTEIFGPDLNTAVVDGSAGAPGVACQSAVVKDTDKAFSAMVKELGGCLTFGLKNATIVNKLTLGDCVDAINNDSKGKITKALTKLDSDVASRCDPALIPALFPGNCAAAPDLAACITERANCRACVMFNEMHATSTVDCDEFDDTTINGSCP